MAMRSARLFRQFAATGSGWRFTPLRQLRRLQPAVDRKPRWVTAEEAVSVIQSGLLPDIVHDLDLDTFLEWLKCCLQTFFKDLPYSFIQCFCVYCF